MKGGNVFLIGMATRRKAQIDHEEIKNIHKPIVGGGGVVAFPKTIKK